jgi:hypothetical protein
MKTDFAGVAVFTLGPYRMGAVLEKIETLSKTFV